jgi:CheY-like chemotaxis protein
MPHILVIDDNAANLKLVCDILECEGYSVDRATDAEAALVKVTASRFDLALTRILKANELTRRVPVIAVTAFAMKGDDQRAIKAGCDGYITKPIDTRRLVKQIEGYLSGGARRAGHNGDFR